MGTGRSQRRKVGTQGYASDGSFSSEGGLSPAIVPPVLSSISPTTKVSVTGGVFTLTCTGTNFTRQSRIKFAGVERTTTYVSPTSLTCSLDCANFTAGAVNVFVLSGPWSSAAKTFTFT